MCLQKQYTCKLGALGGRLKVLKVEVKVIFRLLMYFYQNYA